MASRPLRLEIDELKTLRLPAVLHWDLNHFVVIKSVSRNSIDIHDPSHGHRTIPNNKVSEHFTGVALELLPTKDFEKKREVRKIKLMDFWKQTDGLRKSLFYIFLLSLILQAFSLAAPFYSQLIIDEVLTRLDINLLGTITIGFVILMILQTLTSVVRQYAGLYLGTQLNFQVASNLFHHLSRLPMAWFERRHIGDVVSRFGSTGPVQGIMTGGIIGATLNVLTFIGALTLLLIYSPLLTGIIASALLIYFGLRLALYRVMKRLAEDAIIASAKQDSIFMETIRGMQSIKLFGRESEREAVWRNKFAEAVNIGIKSSTFGIWVGVANTFIFGIANLLVMYIGASQVIAGNFTIGMLVAFLAYKGQFEGAATALVDGAIAFKMLDIHLERLADIGLEEREAGFTPPLVPTVEDPHADRFTIGPQIADFRKLRGAIDVRDLRFRYAEGEPWVLDGANFSIKPGEFIAVAGPSGGGKTTLLKLMLALHDPVEGEILIDQYSLDRLGRQALRKQTGVVMQEDQLLSGSIAENIAFFEPAPDWRQIEACAKQAVIDDDISAMPMGYQSLIGDMGTTLSGGQKQRILLARALYRKPRILLLDEGTANLDPKSEDKILEHICSMPITRICIAHRQATLEVADRILWVESGLVTEVNFSQSEQEV